MRIVRERRPPTISISVKVVFPVVSEAEGADREKVMLQWMQSAVRNHHVLCAGNMGFDCEIVTTAPTVVKQIAGK